MPVYVSFVENRQNVSIIYYLAEQDGLKVPACNKCHNMGKQIERIHENIMAEKLSKMLGQAIYESKIGTREEFRKRYGKSYL